MDEEAFEYWQGMLSYLLNGWATSSCVVSGVLLNLFCIYIFLKQPGRRPDTEAPVIQYYLVALTAWQTALLANAFLLYSFPTLLFGCVVMQGEYVRIFPYVYTLANMTHTGSVWIVLTLTIDRYLALCKPLTHRAIGKRKRVKRLMLLVSSLAIVFCLPRFFEVQVTMECSTEEATNSSGDVSSISCTPTIGKSRLPDNATYWLLYRITGAVLFVTLVPCLLLFALTLRISVALRKAGRKRESMCQAIVHKNLGGGDAFLGRNSSEHRSNIMLVLVIAKFLVSDVLPTMLDTVEHIVGGDAFMGSKIATLAVDVSNFLLVLNCATNFWVYVIWGRRFRHSCRQVFRQSYVHRLLLRNGAQSSNNSDGTARRSSVTTIPNSSRYGNTTEYGSNGVAVNGNVAAHRSRARSILTDSNSTTTLLSNGCRSGQSQQQLLMPPGGRRRMTADGAGRRQGRRASEQAWNEYQKTRMREDGTGNGAGVLRKL